MAKKATLTPRSSGTKSVASKSVASKKATGSPLTVSKEHFMKFVDAVTDRPVADQRRASNVLRDASRHK